MQKVFFETLSFFETKCYSNAIFFLWSSLKLMDYKKKSLKKLKCPESYEEIDTRLATGWYVDTVGNHQEKKYKTKKVSYKISKKI